MESPVSVRQKPVLGFRLSLQQERLWRLRAGGISGDTRATVLLEGPLQARVLAEALRDVIRKHEALRTTFHGIAGLDLPVQVVSPPVFDWRETDLSDLPAGEQEARLRALADGEGRPGDLSAGPLVCACLARLAPSIHALLLHCPSLVADGRSLDTLAGELSRVYAARITGEPEESETMQYIQFSEWQHELLAEAENGVDQEEWSSPECAARLALSLPWERPAGAVETGARRIMGLPAMEGLADRLNALRGIASREALLLAAWQILLWRLIGRPERMVLGALSDGRGHESLLAALGPFSRWLPVECRLRADFRFSEVAREADRALAGAREVQETLRLGPVGEAPPLFTAGFELEEIPQSWSAAGMSFTLRERSAHAEPCEVALRARVRDGRVDLELRHDPGAVVPRDASRLAAAYGRLLEGALAAPEMEIGWLDLLGAEDRQRLLIEAAAVAGPMPEPLPVHRLVERQAADAPERVAVVVGGAEMTFRELNAEANRLARRLRRLGVGPEDRVGLFLERSVDLLVALLGIWKAGGGYVPLDPDEPPVRLAHVLAETEARAVVTREPLVPRLPQLAAAVVRLDSEAEWIAAESADDLEEEASPGQLAYVLYTSGSTGLPKGVMIEHRSLVHLINALKQRVYAGLTGPLTVAVNAPVTFDGSVKQLVQLAEGHSLAVVPDEVRRDAAGLLVWMERNSVDVLDCTPSQLGLLLAAGWSERAFSRPRLLLVGGEPLVHEIWSSLAVDARTRSWNLYGPTECTVDTTAAAVEGERPHLGGPLANVRVYVVDAGLLPLPEGVPGELLIGGAGVARGYLARPDWTAERFVPDPFGSEPGARLYRSGDRVRWVAGRRLEYLDRLDAQVKVRGLRIELGEIENVLAQHPEVRQAAVIVREEVPGDVRLVAFLIPGSGGAPSAAEMRRFAGARLPEYMVPAAFTVLRALPLSRHGKVDRRALAALPHAAADDEPPAAADELASGPIEQVLAGIWADILRVRRVERDGDFFALGGHSLLATRVIARAREAFGVELPMRALFEAPTLAALAERIEALIRAGFGLEAPPIVPVSRDGELPLSFAQQRLWFLHQLDPGSAAYNSPAALRLAGPLDIEALERSLTEVVRRHEVLRTRFEAVRGRPRQVIVPAGRVRLNLADLGGLLPGERRDAEIRRLAAEAAELPFDLACGPLLRARLVRIGDAEHVCLFTLHHIVSDGWSKSVLVREISVLYRAFTRGEPSPLPELPIQYADFAHWQRRWLTGEVLEAHLRYWRRRLAGAPPLLALPTDRPRPATPSLRGARQSFVLPQEAGEALRRISREEGATLFMTLLAGFQILLHRLTGRDDLVVGTDIANRTRPELEGLIGFFINGLALRTDLSGNPTFRELLARVRALSLEAYAHQDLPFERLVEELQPRRDPSYNPIFQALFVLQNAPREVLDLDGLQLSPFSSDAATAKFDLAVFLVESGERIGGAFEYNTDLFDAATIARINDQFCALLSRSAARPEARLSTLEMLAAEEQGRREPAEERRQEVRPMKFKSIKPKMVSLPQEDLVRAEQIAPGEPLPLILRPAAPGLDLADWASASRSFVESELLAHGGLLFRGFDLPSITDFERFAGSLCPDLFGEYGDLPREGMGGKVYSSTPYPPDKPILFHSESSHLPRWPMKIFFFCVQPAEQGGETPIVDCREVYRRLSPETRRLFEEKHLMYVRNYTEDLDVSWSEFYRTTDRAQVEVRCREMGTEVEWKEGNGLRTRQICRAVTQHPVTGEPVFFNQVQLHHVSALDPEVRRSLLSLFSEEDLPRNVYYGDGTRIEDEVMVEVGTVLRDCAVEFSWQAGDVVLLDNMLIAHSRNPYIGVRKIVVALGQMYSALS